MSFNVDHRPAGMLDAFSRVIPESFVFQEFRGDYIGGTTNLLDAGFARPGSDEGTLVWQIFKCAYDASANLISIKWPQNTSGNASADFEFSWTARAGYTYV